MVFGTKLQINTQCLSIFSHAVNLRLWGNGDAQVNQYKSWLGCLRPFNAVQILYVNDGFGSGSGLDLHIARVLGELDKE